jgi:hypothetical protein
MRIAPEDFGDADLRLIYIARKLKDALRLERLLTEAGLDYLVEADEYSSGTLFPRKRVGAFFYVSAGSDDDARKALRRGGFSPTT